MLKNRTNKGFTLLVIGFLLSMQFTFFRMTGLISSETTSPVFFNALGIISVIGVLLGFTGLAMVLSVKKKKEDDNQPKE